jgi:hypothetical protein
MRPFFAFLMCLGLSAVVHAESYPVKPNPQYTPGDLCSKKDQDFRNYRYSEKIPYCVRNVTSERKAQIYSIYEVPKRTRTNYTVDHFIPLALGGNNSDANLWPEHYKIKELRATLEFDLFQQIENGEISQSDAIDIIVEAKMNPPIAELIILNLFE